MKVVMGKGSTTIWKTEADATTRTWAHDCETWPTIKGEKEAIKIATERMKSQVMKTKQVQNRKGLLMKVGGGKCRRV